MSFDQTQTLNNLQEKHPHAKMDFVFPVGNFGVFLIRMRG
jgi:hypothetical protein